MNDSNKEQLTTNTNRIKSVEPVHATQSGQPGDATAPGNASRSEEEAGVFAGLIA